MRRLLISLLFGWTATLASGQALQYGMLPEEVLEELGKPQSTMSAGGRDIWMYPADGRVTFTDGKVTAIRQLPVDGVNGAVTKSVSMQMRQEAEATAAAEAEAERLATEEALRQEQAMEAAWAEERKQFEEETEAYLNGEYGEGEDYDYELSIGQEMAYLGVEMLIGLMVMVVILKGAFAWSDIHGDWGQMFLPAFAAVAMRAVVEFSANKILGVTDTFHVDHALSYLVLLVTLMKFTHASSLKRAVAVAGAAKLASIVVWSLLSVVLLNLMFG